MAGKALSADEAAVAAAEERFGKGSGALPQSQMGAEGGLSAKAPGKPIVKAKDEDDEMAYEDEEKACKKADGEEEEEEQDEGEEDVEMEKKKARKSEVSSMSSDDLMKAMDVLEATAEGLSGQEPDRRAELAAKASDGTISKAERDELIGLLGGTVEQEAQDEEDFGKSFSEVFASDEQLAQDYEVAPFIERHSQLVAESLDGLKDALVKGLQDTIVKSQTEQQVFNRALAKSFRGIGQVVAEQGDLIKSLHQQNTALSERLGIVEQTPNVRKSRVGSSQPLRKSFAGGEPAAGGMNEEQITEGLNRLMMKSRDNNWIAPCGEPIDRAVTLYETERKITRGMLGDVAKEMGVALQLQ